jgi:glycosyltransferase involved in cell wall biosynthesis
MADSEKLAVVIPVYNEEGAIAAVLEKWIDKLDRMGIFYTINVYNDGSKDHTAEILFQYAQKFSGKVNVCNKTNSGHGPTILQGYNDAADSGFTWIFQIDSDDEMEPENFDKIWDQRENYDFLVGIRDGRKQMLPRKVISFVSRSCVRIFYGKSIWDVNSPYRLMRVSSFSDVFRNIPSDTFAPNVIISGMAARKKMRCFEMPVRQRDRQTGEVSIKKWKLLKAAIKSFRQTVCFAFSRGGK